MCWPIDTQVLSEGEFKYYSELGVGDYVYSVNNQLVLEAVNITNLVTWNNCAYSILIEGKRFNHLIGKDHPILIKKASSKKFQRLTPCFLDNPAQDTIIYNTLYPKVVNNRIYLNNACIIPKTMVSYKRDNQQYFCIETDGSFDFPLFLRRNDKVAIL